MTGDETDKDEVLVTVGASAPRRWIGLTTMAALGVLMVSVAFGTPLGALWRTAFLFAGLAAFWGTLRMHGATAQVLELTRTELRERGGMTLARIDEIERVDRSMFAMKPSNGFLLVLSRPAARVWRPGLWWRLGRRVAVGGVTSGAQTRPMADIISALKSGQV